MAARCSLQSFVCIRFSLLNERNVRKRRDEVLTGSGHGEMSVRPMLANVGGHLGVGEGVLLQGALLEAGLVCGVRVVVVGAWVSVGAVVNHDGAMFCNENIITVGVPILNRYINAF